MSYENSSSVGLRKEYFNFINHFKLKRNNKYRSLRSDILDNLGEYHFFVWEFCILENNA